MSVSMSSVWDVVAVSLCCGCLVGVLGVSGRAGVTGVDFKDMLFSGSLSLHLLESLFSMSTLGS